MAAFARRTGLSPALENPQRYLWTDAFAVCNFLELFERTGDQGYRVYATELIDQVHSVLGRFRRDEGRAGWISGLNDETGRNHPTAGGLRIGKPLKERGVDEVIDEQLEWDRDGQYFHYLTKWMHALCQAAFVMRSSELSSCVAVNMHNGQVIWLTPRSKVLCAGPDPASLLVSIGK